MSIPLILIVDDDPDRVSSSIGLAIRTRGCGSRHPTSTGGYIQITCLGAHVVAVDHYLEHWPERDLQRLAMKPANGFAVAAVLRSQILDGKTRAGHRPSLLANCPGLRGTLPLKAAEHLLAWQHDVEWVFPKGGAVAPRLIAMSKSCRQAPRRLE